MRLRLPLLLASVLLTAISVSFGSETITYSGSIYTWIGSEGEDIHSGGFSLYDLSAGTNGAISTAWTSIWGNVSGNYNTMRFVTPGSTLETTSGTTLTVSSTNTSPTVSFNPFSLGGLIVETGATGYSLIQSGTRTVTIGNTSLSSPTPAVMTINEDFHLGTSAMAWNQITLNTSLSVTVASEKTLSIYTSTFAGSSKSMTVGTSGDSSSTGTLMLYSNAASVGTLSFYSGFLGVGSTSGGVGTLTVGTLTRMDSGAGTFLIDVAAGNASDKIVVTNAYDSTGYLAFLVTGSEAGTFTIFESTGATLSADKVTVTSGLYRGLTLTSNVSGGTVSITVAGAASGAVSLTWNGSSGQTWVNSSSMTSWLNASGGADYFAPTDNVTFGDAGEHTVTIDGTVTPGSMTVDSTEDYSFEGGAISGAGALTKSNSNTLTIASTISAWTGAISIEQGTLTLSGVNSCPSARTVNIASGASLNKNDTGTLIIDPTSSMQGTINVNAGALWIGTRSVASIDWGEAESTVTLANGTSLSINGNSSTRHRIGSHLVLGDNASDLVTVYWYDATQPTATTAQYTFTGDITITGNALVTSPSTWAKSLEFQGALTGSGTLTVQRPAGDGSYNANAFLNIVGDASEFTGSIDLDASNGYSYALNLTSTLASATVTLTSGSSKVGFALIRVMQDSAIGTLNGTSNSLVGATGGNYTLTVGAGSYAGTLTDKSLVLTYGANTNVVSGLGYASTGTLNLVKTGEGALTLSGTTSYTGTTVVEAGTLTLSGTISGMTGKATLLAGTLDLSGQTASMPLLIQSGTLTGATGYSGSKSVTVDTSSATSPASVTLQGLASSAIKSVTLTEGATLTYLDSAGAAGNLDLTGASVVLQLMDANVTTTVGSGSTGSAMIVAESVTLSATNTSLTLTNSDLVSLLEDVKAGETTANLCVSSGSLAFSDAYKSQLLTAGDLLSQLGFAITGINGGALVLNGENVSTSDLYVVAQDEAQSYPDSITSYRALDPYKAVILDTNQSLTVTLAGAPEDDSVANALQVRNLVGAKGAALVVKNTDSTQTAIVLLDNPAITEQTDPITGETIGTNTTMEGSITGGTSVTFVKQGLGTLTVQGAVSADTVQVEEGGLALNGTSTIDCLVLDGTSTPAKVTIGGSTSTTLSEQDSLDTSASGKGGIVTVGSAGLLSLTGSNALAQSSLAGSGAISVGDGASLSLSDSATISGVSLTVNGSVTLNATDVSLYSVAALNGAGVLNMADATLTVNGAGSSDFSGTLAGSGSLQVTNGSVSLATPGNDRYALIVSNATVTVDASGSSSTRRAALATGSGSISYSTINLQSGARLIVGSSSATDQKLEVGAGGISLASGSSLTFYLSPDNETSFKSMAPLASTTGAITLNSGATVELLDDNTLVSADSETLELVLMSGGATATVGNVSFLAAFLETVYDNLVLSAVGNNVVLTGTVREDNIFSVPHMTPNATAGAELLWKSRFALRSGSTTLKDAYLSISEMVAEGNVGVAKKSMAAIAGSTVNALGTAQRDALQSQLGWIRNRTVTMGLAPDYVYDDLPYYHLWIEGTGTSAQLDTKDDEGGYKLDSWGGTVGSYADLSVHSTIGVSFSAQFGSLTSSAAEYASGDLDSYYVSVFGRYQQSAWAHTVILTGSWCSATLDRTVDYGTGWYTTQGDTDGSGFGAMYELTYDIPLNEVKSSLLQPLFNAAIVSTTMDTYSETGADNAGLVVGKQEWTSASLALGARWLGIVGTNLFGREALLEVRAAIAQNLGDHQGKSLVALQARPDFTQPVYGAKESTTAYQLGIALHLPVGQQASVFVTGNADVRSGAHSFNGSIGYRYSF